jgi:hypothetical protein
MTNSTGAIDNTSTSDSQSKFNSTVALAVAIAATFMALAAIKESNIDQTRGGESAQAINTWAYFQAKNTRLTLAQATIEQLRALQSLVNNPSEAAKLEAAIAKNVEDARRYENEKENLRLSAEALQEASSHLGIFHRQLDLSKAALAVSIAMCGVAALTRKKWLLKIALAFIAFGLFWGLAAFFGISISTGVFTAWLS